MKFFIDTANLDQIREANAMGVLDGVTTNPSLMAKENIILHMERNAVSINGDGRNVKSVTLSDGSELECDAVFIFVGIVPNSELLDGMARLEGGFVWTDDHMMTSVPGLFAAGDVRTTPFRQVVTAASDGATAAHAADSYIQNM